MLPFPMLRSQSQHTCHVSAAEPLRYPLLRTSHAPATRHTSPNPTHPCRRNLNPFIALRTTSVTHRVYPPPSASRHIHVGSNAHRATPATPIRSYAYHEFAVYPLAPSPCPVQRPTATSFPLWGSTGRERCKINMEKAPVRPELRKTHCPDREFEDRTC